MKKLIPIVIILFCSISLVFALNIESCKSEGRNNWECHKDDICVCRISGDCTNGHLLVYETDVRNLFCIPRIVNGYVDIDWDNCDNPTGNVKVRADCEEGQSSQKTITIVSGTEPPSGNGHSHGSTTTTKVTTTTITCNYVCQASCSDDNNPPICYRRVSYGTTGCPGGTTCCQSIIKECPRPQTGTTIEVDEICPYECCVDKPGYEYKPCSQGLICVDNVCKEMNKPSGFSLPGSLIFWIIVASLIPIVAFFIFVLKKDKDQNVPEF